MYLSSIGKIYDELQTQVVLAKIKADIEQLSDSECNGTTITIYSWSSMKKKVLDIIDKYKSESEDK